MIHHVYSVYDKKAQAFMQPFMTVNEATARRAVAQVCTDPNHMFHVYAADYQLMWLASFDDATGLYTQGEHGFMSVCSLLQLLPSAAVQTDMFQAQAAQ